MLARLHLLLAALFVCAAVTAASAQSTTGAVEGRVLDKQSGEPLPGASVTIAGSSIAASTDRDGRFRLSGAPGGAQSLEIRYLGREDLTVSTDVRPGAVTTIADVSMAPLGYAETVTVTADIIRDAQARALNQQ